MVKRKRESGRASTSSLPASSSVSQSRRRPAPVKDDDVYIVECILARSMYRGYSPTGEYEYQYLIRWEGYGPDDDTWEMRSALLDGANELVTEFDSQDHPFFVTDCRVGPTPLYKKSYLVTFGVPPLHAEPSPLYQTLWTTKQELRKRRGITIEAAEMAVQLWHDPNYVAPPRRSTPRTTPRSTPQKQAPSTDVPAQQKRIEKPPVATPRRSTPRVTPQRQARSPDAPVEPLLPRWNRKRTMPQRQARSPDVPVEPLLPRLNRKRTGRLLAVLDEYRAKPRPKSSSAQPRFLVKWEEDGDVKIEWMFRGPVQARFGKAEANAAIDSFRWVPEIKQEDDSENEYELERAKNIAANRDMMMQLGLLL